MSATGETLRRLSAQSQAISDELGALALLLDPPAPTPAPEPAPPAPPPAPGVKLMARAQNRARMVVWEEWWEATSSYHRYPDEDVAAPVLWFVGADMVRAARRPLTPGTYVLLIDDEIRATTVISPGNTAVRAPFNVRDFDTLPKGRPLLHDIIVPEGETSAPIYFEIPGALEQDTMPLVTANYTFIKHQAAPYFFGVAPAGFDPTPRPLPPLECPPLPALTSQAQLRQTHLVPWREYDTYRPLRLKDGLWTTVNIQAYAYFHLVGKMPSFPLLDGARGRGNVMMPTHLQLSHSGGCWFTDPWRFGVVRADGGVATLAGWRHQYPGATPELVGDWSAVPAERRGFHELWGVAWDARTLPRTGPATIDIAGTMMAPHDRNPVAFLADSQRNRIIRLEFDRADAALSVPPKVSEFIVGLADPFDVACVDGVLYVSERGVHRIAAWDATTGGHLRNVVAGRALTRVTPDTRFVYRLGSGALADAEIRAEPCVGPEGLYHQDGWLYYASRAMAQVRRVHLTTGAIEIVVPECKVDGNSHFIKIAVSDGTFGPRGKVFYSSWTSDNAGRPMGVPGNFNDSYVGPGTPWETLGYTSALAVGSGRLICGSSSEGLTVIHARKPDDVVVPIAEWRRLKEGWFSRGRQLLHGNDGHGFLGLPLPWGEHPDDDKWLMLNGHAKPA